MVSSGSTISAKPVCAVGCQAEQTSADLPLVVDNVMRGSWQVTSGSPTAAGVVNTQHLRFALKLTGATNIAEVDTPDLPDVRCDNETRLGNIGPGCVYPDVTPEFQLNGAAPPLSPVHAAFVASAQQQLPGHPGAVTGTPLHRLIDPVKRAANRAKACAGFSRTDPDDSCDEYPYASTVEGGSGAAVGHVPSDDNSNGGTKLQSFYLRNRVLDGDAFFVTVVS